MNIKLELLMSSEYRSHPQCYNWCHVNHLLLVFLTQNLQKTAI